METAGRPANASGGWSVGQSGWDLNDDDDDDDDGVTAATERPATAVGGGGASTPEPGRATLSNFTAAGQVCHTAHCAPAAPVLFNSTPTTTEMRRRRFTTQNERKPLGL